MQGHTLENTIYHLRANLCNDIAKSFLLFVSSNYVQKCLHGLNLCSQFYNWIGANLQIHKDTTVQRHFCSMRELALNRSRMLENYPGHHRPRITLQMAAKIWEITFNCWGVYFKLAFPVPFWRQLQTVRITTTYSYPLR